MSRTISTIVDNGDTPEAKIHGKRKKKKRRARERIRSRGRFRAHVDSREITIQRRPLRTLAALGIKVPEQM
jgi:hypothetical protein